jgi:hypothetical protein
MPGKLTLSIREKVIQDEKQYARDNGKSLSNIVEEYLKSLSSTKPKSREVELSDLVKELKGSVKLPEGFESYKKTLEDALLEKYLK